MPQIPLFASSCTLSCVIPPMAMTGIDTASQIAFKVSKKIEEISSSSQVIVISHLVQVVANGDNHLFVYKEDGEEKTTSHIKYLTEEELVNEVAKMLSLDKVSESSLASSRELINSFKH